MKSKLRETKIRPATWKYTFTWFSKHKPKILKAKVIATQYMKKINKDRYSGKMIGKRYPI